MQVVLHACAQNPTGIDPTRDQWKELDTLIKEKKHLIIFDMASFTPQRKRCPANLACRPTKALHRVIRMKMPLPCDTLSSKDTRSSSASPLPR